MIAVGRLQAGQISPVSDVFHSWSVVITDWDMPDIGGLELGKRIRHEFQGSGPHLILLSGNTDKEHVGEGLAAGADDYLTKPFHAGELVARVEVGCRIVELHRQIQAKNRLLEEMALTWWKFLDI